MPSPKFTVAIVGGGIAGLTTAIAISRLSQNKDIKIDIYEAAQAFTEIGAGVGAYKRPWDVLKKLGLEEDLKKICQAPTDSPSPRLTFRCRKSDQANGIHFYDVVPPMGLMPFHRPDYLDCLVSNLQRETTAVHFGKRLISYSSSSHSSDSDMPITMMFKDGSTAKCHVLVGADGVHSPTRHTLLELAARDLERVEGGQEDAATLRAKIEPVWSGLTAYRMVANAEKLRSLNPNHTALTNSLLYTGKRKIVATYPIAQGRLVNIGALQCYREKAGSKFEGKLVDERTKEQLMGDYEGWEEEVTQLLQCVEKPNQWIVTEVHQLPICTHGNAVILGDAAHAMTPTQGSGAGQAIEDAYILGSLLGHPAVTQETISIALEIYQQVRLPHAREVQRLSSQAAWILSYQDPRFAFSEAPLSDATEECKAEDVGKLWNIGHQITGDMKWAWSTSAEDDRLQAMKLLEERLGVHS